MSEEGRRIIKLLQRLYAAIKSTNKNVSSMKEDNMVLLWENSSPVSAFAAQTISIDLSDYNWVKVESSPYTGYTDQQTVNEFQCPGVGDTFVPTKRTNISSSSGWWHASRPITIKNTGITFGAGGFRYNTTQTENNSYGIPLRIWGLKKSYSVSLVKDVLPVENGGTGVTSLEELKTKLGVISGGGTGGSSGPLTLSDSRLLQTYLSLKNVELYSSEDLWSSGSKTIPGITNYEKIKVYPWAGFNSIELEKVVDSSGVITYRGAGLIAKVSSAANVHTSAGFVLSVTDGNVVEMTYYGGLNHKTASAYHEAFTTGIRSVVGVEPTAEYIKQKLGISDTTIENGTIKFSPVTVENKVLLWENPKPSEAFTAQTVSVPNLGNYDTYSIIFKTVYSESITNEDTFRYLDGGGYLRIVTSGGTGRRYFTKVDSGLSFVDASYSAYTATTSSISNGYMVPIAIYGIKNNPTVNIPSVDISAITTGTTIDPDKVITLQDYIVEEGASGIWTYRKWNSGIAECWGRSTTTTTLSTAWGTTVYTGTLIDKIEYPFTFSEIPNEVVRLEPTTSSGWIYGENGSSTNVNTTTHTGKYMIARPTSVNDTKEFKADIFVKGFWKTLDTTPKEVAAVKENTARLSIDMDGYEKRTLLWTNSAPTTAFNAQTVTLDLSECDFVDINIKFGNSYHRTQRFKVGMNGMITSNNENTSYTNLCYTRLIEVATTGVTFRDSYFNATKNNAYMIPESIYGVQTTSKLEGKVTGDNLTFDIGANTPADLNTNTVIPSGADLNDYITPGSYLSEKKAISASLSNCPWSSAGFVLQVIRSAQTEYKQILICNGNNNRVYTRWFDPYTPKFGDWKLLGTSTIQKVWTNASPTSSFAAQNIDIDTSDADFVVIVERYSTTSGSSEVFTIIPSMGGYLRTFAGAGYSTTGYCSRYVEFTSSQIKFGDNYLKSINTTTGGTVNNTYQIPTEIYTLKGVL